MGSIDQTLLTRTKQLDTLFDRAIGRLAAGPVVDLRIFFTMAHGFITRQIGKHIDLFASPNPLMRLNDSFATTYLKALDGAPHNDWQRAFRVCKAERDAMASGFIGQIFLSPVVTEACGACMAHVHITRDLRDALKSVPGVDPQDYGNVLIFVEDGNVYAETQLRGRTIGAAAVVVGQLFAKRLNLDVKQWRNDVYRDCYGKDVPDPSSAFASAYRNGQPTFDSRRSYVDDEDDMIDMLCIRSAQTRDGLHAASREGLTAIRNMTSRARQPCV